MNSFRFLSIRNFNMSSILVRSIAGCIFLVFLISPLWVVTYLPFGDLPDHASQINSILNFEHFEDDYRINWFTPYLFAYCLTLALGSIFGVVFSIKFVLSVVIVVYPVVAYKIIKTLDGDVKWIIPSVVTGYSFVLFWGFYSFTIASAVGMVFILMSIHYARAVFSWRTYALFSLFSLFLFFCHALAWLFIVLFSSLVVFCFNNLRDTVKKASAFFVVTPLVMLWVSGTTPGQSGSGAIPGRYIEFVLTQIWSYVSYFIDRFNERTEQGYHTARLMEFFSLTIGKNAVSDYVAIGAFLAFSPLLFGAKLSREWKRWLPFLFTFSFFMIVPYWLFDTAYIYQRFSMFCFVSLLFIFEKSSQSVINDNIFSKQNMFFGLAIFLVFFVVLSHVITLRNFKENDRNFKSIVDHMGDGRSTVYLLFDDGPHLPFTPAFPHYGKWYAATKIGEVNYSFSIDPRMWHSVPLQYKGQLKPLFDSWNSRSFDWRKHRGELYDYFLVRSIQKRDQIFAASGGNIVLLAQEGKWWLYGRKEYTNEPK